MTEGEFKKRINQKKEWRTFIRWIKVWQVNDILKEANKEYPKVSQVQLLVKGTHVDWERICRQMEQKIIAFENFGKKWFGEEHE